MQLIRYLFCTFNLIFCVSGVILTSFGIWLLLENHAAGTFVPHGDGIEEHGDGTEEHGDSKLIPIIIRRSTNHIPVHTMIPALGWICVGVGVATFAVSFVGYCGSLQESLCLLGTYTFTLTTLVMLEIIIVTLFFIYKPKVEAEAKEQLVNLVRTRYSALTKTQARIMHQVNKFPLVITNEDMSEDRPMELQRTEIMEENVTRREEEKIATFTKVLDATMRSFQCCGVVSYNDFNLEQLPPGYVIPQACCKPSEDHYDALKDPDCPYQPNYANSWIATGCFDRVIGIVINSFIIVGVVVGILQLAGIVLSLFGARLVYLRRI